MSRRKTILDKIAQEEKRRESLRAEIDQVNTGLAQLRSALASLGPEEDDSLAGEEIRLAYHRPTSTEEKLSLFRRLFRGRTDVFPKRWENPKTGKSGYSPACHNEWVAGLCVKKRLLGDKRPKGSCGECASQDFIPFDERQVLRHLQGKQVMGVYPMLEDETCWFLAVDFDREGWAGDVVAFSETCRDLGVPVALERSRSGVGAHAWIFFTSSIAAATARQMGCYLITETMTRRHQLSMASYDRLFPSQDTLPKGGFGSLIALPFQYRSVQKGNTVFIDGSLEPYADQWAYLATVRPMKPAQVERIAREASRSGQVVAVRMVWSDDEADEAPWDRPPSGRCKPVRINAPLPERIRAVQAQRLFVEKEGQPSALLNQIKRIAAFQNPEFYKKQRMRLSTRGTPRVISCSEDLPRHLALPRGCMPELRTLLDGHNVSLSVDDQRIEGQDLDVSFKGSLTPVQEQAVTALLGHDTGIFVAPPGIGKTVVGIRIIAERARSTLVLVNRQKLLDQWRTQLSLFLGISQKDIGQIGGGRRKPNGQLDVAMLQSLVREGRVEDRVADYGHVVVDECHHIPAFSFERVLAEAKARFVLGLTATPQRRDGHHPIIHMQLGSVRFSVTPKSPLACPPFEQRLIVRETGFVKSMEQEQGNPSIQEIYRALAVDEERNQLIINDVIQTLEQGRSPVVLTERKDHLDYLTEHLQRFTRNLVVLKGGMTTKKRQEVTEQLAKIPDGEERLLLATGRYIGEGFDDPRLDTLFLAMPISWKGTLMQYAGRLHRLHRGKDEVRIYDYVDRHVPMLFRMFEKRLRGYRSIGYARGESPLGFGEDSDGPDELVIEYDDGAVKQLSLMEED